MNRQTAQYRISSDDLPAWNVTPKLSERLRSIGIFLIAALVVGLVWVLALQFLVGQFADGLRLTSPFMS